MLHLAFLLLAQAAEIPVIKPELKDLPPEGKTGPRILCEGTTNLPDGADLNAYLYYEQVILGRELSRSSATVKAGKFSADFAAFAKRNLPGRYVARLVFNPDLQNQAIPGFKECRVECAFQIGEAADIERETLAVRKQLVDEIRLLTGIGDQVKAKMTELKGKPAADWEPLLKEWNRQAVDVMTRSQSFKIPEYKILNLDLVSDSGLEALTHILKDSARSAAAGNAKDAVEGLTRLHQTAQYWSGEISIPKLSDPKQIVQLIDSARALLRDALGAAADAPVLPVRRRFVEMNSVLDKSLPEDFHGAILEIGTRSVAFFNALADRQPEAKTLHAELDALLEKLAAPLRATK